MRPKTEGLPDGTSRFPVLAAIHLQPEKCPSGRDHASERKPRNCLRSDRPGAAKPQTRHAALLCESVMGDHVASRAEWPAVNHYVPIRQEVGHEADTSRRRNGCSRTVRVGGHGDPTMSMSLDAAVEKYVRARSLSRGTRDEYFATLRK